MKNRIFLFLPMCAVVGLTLAKENVAIEGQPIVLQAARLLDVSTGNILTPGVVVIHGTEIASVNPSDLPANTDTVDLGDVTLLPGLIDVHAHWNGDLDLNREEAADLTPVQRAVRATRNARDTLLAGFTTVRIMGSTEFIGIAIGQAAEDGILDAPRVFGAGYHIRSTTGNSDRDAYKTGSANGIAEVVKAVRYMVENGATWIKVVATPRGGTPIPWVDASTFSPAELEAIVAEANRRLVKVGVHAHGPTGAHNAVMAGVHSIEHGSLIREDTLREMVKRGTYLVPTAYVVPSFKEPGGLFETMPQELQDAENNLLAGHMRGLPLAHKLGVKFAYGTDLGDIPVENSAREFEMLVKVGLSNIEAIRTATTNAADLLGVDDRGRLAPGMLADIIAVPGNPLDNITVLGKVEFVMKGGKIYKRHAASNPHFEVGQAFQDCEVCPPMVVVPAGNFRMGSTRAEQDWSVEQGRPREYTDRENPIHEVTIEQPFAVGMHEVTRGQFSSFVEDTAHQTNDRCQTTEITDGKYTREERSGRDWRNPGYSQTDDHPVVCLTWDDAIAFTEWLSAKTGAHYRLLSEAEWEYVARGGTETYRFWGNDTSNVAGCRYANVADSTPMPNGETWPRRFDCSDGYWATSPVGSYRPNGFGVYDVMGNVWEWVEDCANETYVGAPTNGTAWTQHGDCSNRVLRGGALHEGGGFTRSALRGAYSRAGRFSTDGFRVARDLD